MLGADWPKALRGMKVVNNILSYLLLIDA